MIKDKSIDELKANMSPESINKVERSAKQSQSLAQFEEYEPEWINMAEVVGKDQEWFWQNVIPAHTSTLIAGEGGIGKSLLLLSLIAYTTNGKQMEVCGETVLFPQGHVILLSAEDNISSQIQPKLIVENADLQKIHFIKSKTGKLSKKKRFLELNNDLHILENKIIELRNNDKIVTLLVIDPVTYFLGTVCDNDNPEVANFLQGINDLGEKYQIAMILNKHLRKQNSGGKVNKHATSEISGAGAWVNTPRMCWIITSSHDDPDIKIMTNPKQNLIERKKTETAYAYRIVEHQGRGKMEWLKHKINVTSDEAINDKEAFDKTKQEKAIDFFFKFLKENGQSRYMTIVEAAEKQSITERTIERAVSEIKSKYSDRLSITKEIGSKRLVYELISL